jgi:uncharacterized protein HemY
LKQKLQFAEGFLELGMLVEANDTLDELDPALRATPEVLAVRLQIYLKAKKWSMVLEIARHLAKVQPENPNWFVEWANAARKTESTEAAKEILLKAEAKRHPNDAAIHYYLGCYAAVQGDLEEARNRVKRAIQLEKLFREIALYDPDLDQLWTISKKSVSD